MKYRKRRLWSQLSLLAARSFRFRSFALLGAFILLALVIFPILLVLTLQNSHEGLIFSSTSQLQSSQTAIVLGASVGTDGLSPAVEERVQAGVELYRSGKVQELMMSGSSQEGYNEAVAMRERALELGVPASAVTTDEHSMRTYDTCWRAKYVYSMQSVVLVSQDLHLRRAVYLCDSLGLEVQGFVAEVQGIDYEEDSFRELLAFIKVLWDINLGTPEVSTIP